MINHLFQSYIEERNFKSKYLKSTHNQQHFRNKVFNLFQDYSSYGDLFLIFNCPNSQINQFPGLRFKSHFK